MQKLINQTLKVFLLLFIILFMISKLEVNATGETVSFGSEQYNWEVGTVSPVGVYVNSENNMEAAEMYVIYDPEMLEYQSGGELEEIGRVKISKQGINSVEYKEMLSFLPLMGGDTSLTIRETKITNSMGVVEEIDKVSVGVRMPIPDGCSLETILLNGLSIDGFNSTQTIYNIDMETDTTNAEITVLPEGIQVEISDTNLDVGANEIDIIVTSISGEKARYLININRLEQTDETEQTEQTDETEQTVDDATKAEPTVVMEGSSSAARRNQMIFVAIIFVLIILLVLLILIKIRLFLMKKEVNKHQDRANRKKLKKENKLRMTQAEEVLSVPKRLISKEAEEKKDEREIVIDVQKVTMEFNREKDESTSLKELLIRTLKGQRTSEKFAALKNVSFSVRKGDVVGIVGTNGSGKSTILKIISGALIPTKGIVEVDKSKVQLLTLGTGFDFELTGRENVYLNGAIIGYTKAYIDENYDEIVKFAELEGFMDEKVRNYSSGMVSRLGFAIATVRNTPEILILDEVLSVGDMFFRTKSEKRIQEMIHGGSTVLIVSHSSEVIKKNCTKAVWIEKGRLRAIGNPQKVCGVYANMSQKKKS